jgi:hypothetical protein
MFSGSEPYLTSISGETESFCFLKRTAPYLNPNKTDYPKDTAFPGLKRYSRRHGSEFVIAGFAKLRERER